FIKNVQGIVERRRNIGKQIRHFELRLHIKVTAWKCKSLGLVNFIIGIDTKQYIMYPPVVLFQIMRIIGTDDPDLILLRKFEEDLVDIFLTQATVINILHIAVALKFNIIILTKQVEPPPQSLLCFVLFAADDQLRDFSADTTTRGDQSFVILFNEFFVNPGKFAVQSLDIPERAEF